MRQFEDGEKLAVFSWKMAEESLAGAGPARERRPFSDLIWQPPASVGVARKQQLQIKEKERRWRQKQTLKNTEIMIFGKLCRAHDVHFFFNSFRKTYL